MSQPDQSYTSNTLLRALSPDDYELLKPHLTRVTLEREQKLITPNEPIKHVFFVEAGIASIVSVMARSGRTECGIFGREGVSATCLLLDTDRSPHETFMQVVDQRRDSTALSIDTEHYLAAIRRSESLRLLLLRYVQTVLVQSAQSAAMNAAHRMESRLARWLLMCHDRIDGDEVALTHEFMGIMISADRSGITTTLHVLEGAGMIRSERGRVIIRQRGLLEDMAGDSYGMPEAEYRRLVGPLGKVAEMVVC